MEQIHKDEVDLIAHEQFTDSKDLLMWLNQSNPKTIGG